MSGTTRIINHLMRCVVCVIAITQVAAALDLCASPSATINTSGVFTIDCPSGVFANVTILAEPPSAGNTAPMNVSLIVRTVFHSIGLPAAVSNAPNSSGTLGAIVLNLTMSPCLFSGSSTCGRITVGATMDTLHVVFAAPFIIRLQDVPNPILHLTADSVVGRWLRIDVNAPVVAGNVSAFIVLDAAVLAPRGTSIAFNNGVTFSSAPVGGYGAVAIAASTTQGGFVRVANGFAYSVALCDLASASFDVGGVGGWLQLRSSGNSSSQIVDPLPLWSIDFVSGVIDVSHCATVVSIAPINGTSVAQTPPLALNVSLGMEGSGAVYIQGKSLMLRVSDVNVSLVVRMTKPRVALSAQSALVKLEAIDASFPVVLRDSRAMLQVTNLSLDGATLFLLGSQRTVTGASVMLNSSDIMLRSTTIAVAAVLAAPLRGNFFGGWLMYAIGTGCVVGAGTTVRLDSDVHLLLPGDTTSLGTPVTAPLFVSAVESSGWDPVARVFANCSATSNRVSVGALGSFPFSDSCGLSGVPTSSIVDQCYATKHTCETHHVVERSGVHVFDCPLDTLSIVLRLSNATSFVQLYVVAMFLDTLDVMQLITSPSGAATRTNVSVVLDAGIMSFDSGGGPDFFNPRHVLVNTTVAALAIVFESSFSIIEQPLSRLLTIAAPPVTYLLVRLSPSSSSAIAGFDGTAIYIEGDFPLLLELDLLGQISTVNVVRQSRFIVCNASSTLGVRQANVRIGNATISIKDAAPLLACPTSSVVADIVAFYSHTRRPSTAADPPVSMRVALYMVGTSVLLDLGCTSFITIHKFTVEASSIRIHGVAASHGFFVEDKGFIRLESSPIVRSLVSVENSTLNFSRFIVFDRIAASNNNGNGSNTSVYAWDTNVVLSNSRFSGGTRNGTSMLYFTNAALNDGASHVGACTLSVVNVSAVAPKDNGWLLGTEHAAVATTRLYVGNRTMVRLEGAATAIAAPQPQSLDAGVEMTSNRTLWDPLTATVYIDECEFQTSASLRGLVGAFVPAESVSSCLPCGNDTIEITASGTFDFNCSTPNGTVPRYHIVVNPNNRNATAILLHLHEPFRSLRVTGNARRVEIVLHARPVDSLPLFWTGAGVGEMPWVDINIITVDALRLSLAELESFDIKSARSMPLIQVVCLVDATLVELQIGYGSNVTCVDCSTVFFVEGQGHIEELRLRVMPESVVAIHNTKTTSTLFIDVEEGFGSSSVIGALSIDASGASISAEGLVRIVVLLVASTSLISLQMATQVVALGVGSYFVNVDGSGAAKWIVRASGRCELNGAIYLNALNALPLEVALYFDNFTVSQSAASTLLRFGAVKTLDVVLGSRGNVTLRSIVAVSVASLQLAQTVSMLNARVALESATLLSVSGACNRTTLIVAHSTLTIAQNASLIRLLRQGARTPFTARVSNATVAVVALSAVVTTNGWLVGDAQNASVDSLVLAESHLQLADASKLLASPLSLVVADPTSVMLSAIRISSASLDIVSVSYLLMNVYARGITLTMPVFRCHNNSGFATYGEGASGVGVVIVDALAGTFTSRSFLIRTSGGPLNVDLDIVGANVQMADSGFVQVDHVGSLFSPPSGLTNATIRLLGTIMLSGPDASIVQVLASGGQLIQLRNVSIHLEHATIVVDILVQSWLIWLAMASGSIVGTGSNIDGASQITMQGLTLDATYVGGRDPAMQRSAVNFVWRAPVVIMGCDNMLLRASTATTIVSLRITASDLTDVPESLVENQCTACLLGDPFVYSTSGEYVYDCPNAPNSTISIAPPANSLAVIRLTTLSPFASMQVSGFANSIVVVIGGVAPVNTTRSAMVISPANIFTLQIVFNTTVVINGSRSFADINALPKNALVILLTRWSSVVCSPSAALQGCLVKTTHTGLLLGAQTLSTVFEGNVSFRSSAATSLMYFSVNSAGKLNLAATWSSPFPVRISATNTIISVVATQLGCALSINHSSANHGGGTTSPLLVFEAMSNFLLSSAESMTLNFIGALAFVGLHETVLMTGDVTSCAAVVVLTNNSQMNLFNTSALLASEGHLSSLELRIDERSSIALFNGSNVFNGRDLKNVDVAIDNASVFVSDDSAYFRTTSNTKSYVVRILRSNITVYGATLLKNRATSLSLSIRDGTRIVLNRSSVVESTSVKDTTVDLSQGSVTVHKSSSIVSLPTGGLVTVSNLAYIFDGVHVELAGDGAALLVVPVATPNGNVPANVLLMFRNASTVLVGSGAALFRGAAGISASTIASSNTTFAFLNGSMHALVSATPFEWSSSSAWTFFNCSTTVGVVNALGVTSRRSPLRAVDVGIPLSATRYIPGLRSCLTWSATPSVSSTAVAESGSATNTSGGSRSLDTLSLTPSCRASTSATHTHADAVPALPVRATPLGAGGQSVAVVAGAVSPASRGPTIQRAVLALRLLSCDLSIDDPPDVSTSPTQLRVKDDVSGYQRGTVIGNLILCAALALLCFCGCVARQYFLKVKRGHDVTLWRAAASLQLPGWPVIFYTFLCQPLLSSALCLLYVASNSETMAGDVILGVFGAACVLGGCAAIGWVLVFRFYSTRHHNVAPVRPIKRQRATTCSFDFLCQALTTGSRAEFPWRDADSRHLHYTKHYGALFDAYRETRHWFHCVELLFIVVSGVVESLATAYVDSMCSEMLVVLCVTQVGYAIVVLVLRPHESRFEWGLSVIVACLGGGFGILALIPECPACVDAGEILVSGQIYFSFVELCVTVLQLVWSGRAKRFLGHVMLLSSRRTRQGRRIEMGDTPSSSASELNLIADDDAPRSPILEAPLEAKLSPSRGDIVEQRRAAQQHRLATNRARLTALSRSLQDREQLAQLATLVGRICQNQRAKHKQGQSVE